MLKPRITIVAATLLFSTGSAAQVVPEGIHSLAEGPSEMCGLTGDDATDFARKVQADRSLMEQQRTERYLLFASKDQLNQWVLSTDRNFAHPLVTCRHTYKADDGVWMMNRGMRCDDDRASCDKAYLEFQALDEQVKHALGGG